MNQSDDDDDNDDDNDGASSSFFAVVLFFSPPLNSSNLESCRKLAVLQCRESISARFFLVFGDKSLPFSWENSGVCSVINDPLVCAKCVSAVFSA